VCATSCHWEYAYPADDGRTSKVLFHREIKSGRIINSLSTETMVSPSYYPFTDTSIISVDFFDRFSRFFLSFVSDSTPSFPFTFRSPPFFFSAWAYAFSFSLTDTQYLMCSVYCINRNQAWQRFVFFCFSSVSQAPAWVSIPSCLVFHFPYFSIFYLRWIVWGNAHSSACIHLFVGFSIHQEFFCFLL